MYELGCQIRDGRLCWCKGSFVGCQNDAGMHHYYRMYDNLLEKEFIVADLGYYGMPHAITPYKRDGGRVLTVWESEFNVKLSQVCVLVENAIGRIKAFNILRVLFCHNLYQHALIFGICAHLANIRMMVDPICYSSHALLN